MLSVDEALGTVLLHAKPRAVLSVELADLPLGYVLAEEIQSDIDSPPYTKSMMDGYALRSEDCINPPTILQVAEEIAAGKMPTKTVAKGQASRVMTGAPIPDGADAVVMVERTELVSPNEVRVQVSAKRGQHILERGKEMKAGEVVLSPGTILGPQDLGMLAAVGHKTVSVLPKPKVGVLPTGDEIVEPQTRPGPGQIRNSNGLMLLGQVERSKAIPQYLGIARDTVESLRTLIKQGIDENDVLLLSGGVSAGKYDLVPGVLQELGVISHFHKVLMKPGKPLYFGTRGDKLIFGLPGNPVSSFVCFELFVRPALNRMRGMTKSELVKARLPIGADFRTENDRPTYWPAKIEWDQDPRLFALPWGGSAFLRDLQSANALLAVPQGEQAFAKSEMVEALLIA